MHTKKPTSPSISPWSSCSSLPATSPPLHLLRLQTCRAHRRATLLTRPPGERCTRTNRPAPDRGFQHCMKCGFGSDDVSQCSRCLSCGRAVSVRAVYKLLKPWWEVFMDYLLVLMLMVSILAGTLLLSRDGVVCVPVHSFSTNYSSTMEPMSDFVYTGAKQSLGSPAKGRRTNLDYQQYVYISQVAITRRFPGSRAFYRIALSHTAKLDTRFSEAEQVTRPKVQVTSSYKTRKSSLDSGTDSPLLAGTDSASTTTQPSPCPSTLSHCSTLSARSLNEPLLPAQVVPDGSRPGATLDRSDREQARALFERVRRFRAHCESSDVIFKVYTAQTVFKVLKFVLIVSYTTPLLSSISFSHVCQLHSHALTGYSLFQCSHSLSSVLRKLMQAYISLLFLFGLLGVYALFWIFHNETRLLEESLERRWGAERLRSMITSDSQGQSLLQLVALPRLPPALFTLSQLQVLKLELIGDAKLTAQISNMTTLRHFPTKATFKKAHKARSVEFLERCKEDNVEKRRDQCTQRSPPVPPSPPGAPARLYPPQAHRFTCCACRRAALTAERRS
ncbi:volume-regulated anion channel subunit LRRC8D [Pimephales promelas]|nr:volume-regulated anion channel subunit LRRC8D [Pimephales promelas]